jgi:hypothetical protein
LDWLRSGVNEVMTGGSGGITSLLRGLDDPIFLQNLDRQLKPVLRAVLFHGMEDSVYNLKISTLKTKDLEYSEPLRKCSGQERTNDVTAPNCSDNLASKSTRCGRRAMTLGRPRSLTYETSLG